MICPHCGYDPDGIIDFDNDYGKFYKLPIKLERQSDRLDCVKDEAKVYGCPRCKQLFLVD